MSDETVPDDDVVCRFMRAEEWSESENRPRANAFKRSNMTVWHEDRILASGSQMSDLQIGQLHGSARAYYAAGDFSAVAKEVKCETGEYAEASVLWNHSDEAVPYEWSKWKCAHAEVNFRLCGEEVTRRFRAELAIRARRKVSLGQ